MSQTWAVPLKPKFFLPWPSRGFQVAGAPLFTGLCLAFQYHINKLSIMSSENHLNNSDKEVDEVDAALSDLEITLEGGKTSTILVRAEAGGVVPYMSPPRHSPSKNAFFFHASNQFYFLPLLFFFYFCSCWKKVTMVEQCRTQSPVIFFIKPVFFWNTARWFWWQGTPGSKCGASMELVKALWSRARVEPKAAFKPSLFGVFTVNIIGIATGIECINTFFLQRLEDQTVLEKFWRSQDLAEPPAPSHLPTQIMENSNKIHLVSVLVADFPKYRIPHAEVSLPLFSSSWQSFTASETAAMIFRNSLCFWNPLFIRLDFSLAWAVSVFQRVPFFLRHCFNTLASHL